MANLTIVVPDEVLKKARLLAINEGTSVNALIREYLETYTGIRSRQAKAMTELLEMSKKSRSRRGAAQWSRNDLHERKP